MNVFLIKAVLFSVGGSIPFLACSPWLYLLGIAASQSRLIQVLQIHTAYFCMFFLTQVLPARKAICHFFEIGLEKEWQIGDTLQETSSFVHPLFLFWVLVTIWLLPAKQLFPSASWMGWPCLYWAYGTRAVRQLLWGPTVWSFCIQSAWPDFLPLVCNIGIWRVWLKGWPQVSRCREMSERTLQVVWVALDCSHDLASTGCSLLQKKHVY